MKSRRLNRFPFKQPSFLTEARLKLREEQQKYVPDNLAFQLKQPEDQTKQALQFLKSQKGVVRTDNPKVVMRGVFVYNASLEKGRISRAEALIRRVAPGPFEDPNYLALIAYEAASVELGFTFVLEDEMARKRVLERYTKFLLGTIHSPVVNAFAMTHSVRDYSIVVLYSGLVDFIYQTAKAVVDALEPTHPEDDHAATTASSNIQKIADRLKKNRSPIDRVWKTLEAYFYNGYPRAFYHEPVKVEHIPTLNILVGMAERWVIAHEYGHGLEAEITRERKNAKGAFESNDFVNEYPNDRWTEEILADLRATILTVLSASVLDGYSPEFSLGGGIFALSCLNILRMAISVLRTGKVHEDSGTISHPPTRSRQEQLITSFRTFFDVKYSERGSHHELNFVLRKEPPQDHAFTGKRIEHAFLFANVLEQIWIPLEEILVSQYQSKRLLHPMWRR